ncbi:MAG: lysine--tRNA ligase [Myxococcota bacterium]
MSERETEVRRERLAKLREGGVEAFPARVPAHEAVAELRRLHDPKDAEQLEREANRAAVAGRLRAKRSFGKLLFLTLGQDGAALQLSARKGETDADTFAFLRQLDVGDFVHAEGTVWRTQKGELTLAVNGAQLLAKALRPLPEKWHGLADVEARYRQRYLDLLSNERAREIAVLRSRTLRGLRNFLDGRGFLEVETPVLQPLYGGAAARPFTTHHHGYDQPLYLRISDELYLKRLVIGGLDRVYEIAHNFRNEGISHKHSPEFTMLECYQAYADYSDMMDLVQAMLCSVAEAVLGGLSVSYGEGTIELGGSWRRVTIRDAVRDATGVDILEASDLPSLQKALAGAGVEHVEAPSWAQLVDDVFSTRVEPELIQPTFVTHHPTELSPLAKRSPDDPRLVERFELFLAGMELANAFSELNDPDDQRARFEEQRKFAAEGDEEAHPLDEDFLAALEHGMPPTGGLGVGVDRLVRVLADAPNLREVILFPHLRPEKS